MSSGRFVLVAFDKTNGDLLFSPEMMRHHYSEKKAKELLATFDESDSLDSNKHFFLLPYEVALSIKYQEQTLYGDDQGKTREIIN